MEFNKDEFEFCVCLKEKPFTRRVLSTVSSLYDPLGFIAPVILRAKILLQDLCRRKFGWDEPFCGEDERAHLVYMVTRTARVSECRRSSMHSGYRRELCFTEEFAAASFC